MTQPVSELENEDFGELEVAEYLVFLLALDTYMRYVEEHHGEGAEDDLTQRGIALVRLADRQHMDTIRVFLDGNLPSVTHKRMLSRAFVTLPTHEGLSKRTFKLRTLMSRGGAATMRAVFKSNKALREIREAMAASAVEDADKALDLFEAIPLRNQRLRSWIDKAAESAGSGQFQNPVAAASNQATEELPKLYAATTHQDAAAPSSEASKAAGDERKGILSEVEAKATTTAQRAMQVSGAADEPPKRSEVIGIATAAAAAAMSDPSVSANVPPSLRGLDPEQTVAAMTDGRVLVAAGAGSGKTTTLISRIAYLVQEQKVSPSRIFCVSFNKKAAAEIRERVAAKVGQDALDQMSIGTMHSMFKRMVVEYGTSEEKAALTTWAMGSGDGKGKASRDRVSRAPTPGVLGGFMSRIWKECFDEDPPRRSRNVIQGWIMNDITPAQAASEAANEDEQKQALWYEWLQGFKGIDKNWSPPCIDSNDRADSQWNKFLTQWRGGGKARLGDFSDMIVMFRDLLKRSSAARLKVQGMFDHICVDEAQDLNLVQHQIIEMMSEHVGDGSDGRSLWIVGDEIQSINRFVGARPELFAQFNGKEGWKTRSIATNYRCLPEIVEHANQLMADHPRGIPMAARPDATKPRGQASIVVQTPDTHATGAIQTIAGIKQDVDAGNPITDYAVLTRTNMEINDFETSCIIMGVPYGRKGGTSFLKSPETITVMSYFNLTVGQDFERMQKSLGEILDKPRRFFLKGGDSQRVVQEVVARRARELGVSIKDVNPLMLFDRPGINAFLDAMDPDRRWESWKVRDAGTWLESLGRTLDGLRRAVDAGTWTDRVTGKENRYTTQDLFADILNIKGAPESRGEEPPTLQDVLMPASGGQEEEADDPDQDDGTKKPIGNVQFLFHLSGPTPESPETDPSDPHKFKARIDQLVADSKELRVDLDEWDVQQSALEPSKRQKPPCVVLSTVHSVKGAQWNNTTVVMAKGLFPMTPRAEAGADLTSEQEAKLAKKQHEDFLTERQLAYVAMTRAAKRLTLIGPSENAYGKEGGVSEFVAQAGLKPGQNVAGKNDPTPDAPEPGAGRTVLAFCAQRELSDFDDSYDRRMP